MEHTKSLSALADGTCRRVSFPAIYHEQAAGGCRRTNTILTEFVEKHILWYDGNIAYHPLQASLLHGAGSLK